MSSFVPRQAFDHLQAIPRAYFLGHHRSALTKFKGLVASIDLVVECRDYRIPLVSRNPLFEEYLGEKPRLILYTKQDLGSNYTAADRKREEIIQRWDSPSHALFSDKSRVAIRKVLDFAKEHAKGNHSLFGTRLIVVGIPNCGKSTLLNALRNVSLGKKKAAQTGDQPGVTRKIGTSVKILEGEDGKEGVYVLDSPGVSEPYVPDAESMLKLSLCGNVKDTVIPPTTVADYLLFHLNLKDSKLYSQYCEPTNDIFVLLEALARKQGRLKKGNLPDHESAALQLIQRWRGGHLGKFVLDNVTEEALAEKMRTMELMGGSLNQARKAAKQLKKEQYKLST